MKICSLCPAFLVNDVKGNELKTEMCMFRTMCIVMFVSLTALAGKPSWNTFAFHIDGVKAQEDAELIQKTILKVDPKMIQ